MERYKGESWKKYYMYLVKYIGQGPGVIIMSGVNLNRLDLVIIGVGLGGDINNPTNYFYPLRYASSQGDLDIVEYLINQGADDVEMSLQWASGSGQLDVVKYLSQVLTNQGNDITNWGTEAIKNATRVGHLGIVEYLAENGADPGNSIIDASKYGQYEIVKYLIDNKFYVKNDLHTSLKFASETGNLDLVKYLVEHGASVKYNDYSPLMSAIVSGNLELVKYLVERGS